MIFNPMYIGSGSGSGTTKHFAIIKTSSISVKTAAPGEEVKVLYRDSASSSNYSVSTIVDADGNNIDCNLRSIRDVTNGYTYYITMPDKSIYITCESDSSGSSSSS